MGLFNKRRVVATHYGEPIHEAETGYQEVVDYLTALSLQDYNKIIKVANIYRNADKDVKKVLNIKPDAQSDGFTQDELDEIFILDAPKIQAGQQGEKGGR